MIMNKPYDYRLLYLESTGTQYIDTGFVPDNTSGFSIRVATREVGAIPIGVRQSGGNNRWALYLSGSKTVQFGWNTFASYTFTIGNKWFECELNFLNSRVGTINGTTYRDSLPTLASISRSSYLFAGNWQGTAQYFFTGIISNVQISRGTEIVMDFIPVVKDGVGYMYDQIGGELYGNVGTGDFICGPRVREFCSLENLEEYTKRIYPRKDNILIENDGIWQIKDNSVYPVAHPDLSTQPSILPQRFGNLKMYEVVSRVEALEKYFAPFSKDVCDNAYIIPVVEVLGERNAVNNLTDSAGSVDLVNYSPYVVVADSSDTFFMNQLCLVNGKPALYGGTVGSNTFIFMLDGFLRDIPIRLHDADIKSEGLYNMDGHTLALGMDGEAYAIIARWDINPFTSQSHTTAQMDIRCNIKQPYLLKDVPEGVRVVHADVWGQNRLVPCELEKREDGKWVIPHLDFEPEFVTVQYLGEDSGYYYYDDDKKKQFTFWVGLHASSFWPLPQGCVLKELRKNSYDSTSILFDEGHNSIIGDGVINVLAKIEVESFEYINGWATLSLNDGVTSIFIESGDFLPVMLLSSDNGIFNMFMDTNIADVRVPLNGEIGSDIGNLTYANAIKIYCKDESFYGNNPDFTSAVGLNGNDWHDVLTGQQGSSSLEYFLNLFSEILYLK